MTLDQTIGARHGAGSEPRSGEPPRLDVLVDVDRIHFGELGERAPEFRADRNRAASRQQPRPASRR